MEVRVKLDGLDKLKLTTKMEEDDVGLPRLKTMVSFEVDGKMESLARVLNLARQRAPLYAVVGCEQAMFDLQLTEIREEDKRKAQASADKAKAAKRKVEKKAAPKPLEANAAGVKLYRVTYRPTGELRDVASSSAQGACELCGWMIGNCHVAEVPTTEPQGSDGRAESPRMASDNGSAIPESLAQWMDEHAVPDQLKGGYVAPCPFHEDKGKSLQVWPDLDMYECVVCGSCGALRRLAERLGLVLEGAGEPA